MKILDRPLPSLAQWLGDGARADGFEEWVKETVFIERAVTNEAEASAVRMVRTMAIAMMEACRIETERHGRNAADVLVTVSRVTGCAAMAAVLSIIDHAKGPPPLMRVARELGEEYAHGAKLMAKAHMEGVVAAFGAKPGEKP